MRLLLILVPLVLVPDCRCVTADKEKGDAAAAFQARYVMAIAQRAAQCSGSDADALLATQPIHAFITYNVHAAAAEERMIYDASRSEACINYLRNAPCADVHSLFDERPIASPCTGVLAGSGPPGSLCYHANECQPSGFCSANELRCPGECKIYIGVDQPCGPDDQCLPGSDCRCTEPSCPQKICKQRVKKGERCETKEAPGCARGLYCPPDGAKGAGHCQSQTTTGTCPMFEACLPPARCVGFDDVEHPGHCMVPKKVGESCTEGIYQCTDFASCVGGVCKGWNRVGEPCGGAGSAKETSRCTGGWCDLSAGTNGLGICKAYRTAEAGCVGDTFLDFECGPGRCDRLMHKCIYPCIAPPIAD